MSQSNPIQQFMDESRERVAAYGADEAFQSITTEWSKEAYARKYIYNFQWMGRPIIQYPQDIMMMQELIWAVQPDVIVETGIAHGGSLIFNASMLELLGKPDSLAIGIDIDIRAHNRAEIEKHPMFRRIRMIEGSSVEQSTLEQVKALIKPGQKVLVVLDSMHTHDHVLKELELYAPLVAAGSYIVVQDTHVEDLPDELWADRPWSHGNSPKSAVFSFIREHASFEIDPFYEQKAMITCARSGFLKRKA